MGLSNETVKGILAGNGSNVVFAIPFDIIISDTSEVVVYIRDESVTPATETLQVISTDYTLTGGVGSGFNTDVTFVTAPLATDKVLITRVLPKTQTLDLATSTDSQPESTEKQLDRIVAQVQETKEATDRSLKLVSSYNNIPAGIEPAANEVLYFDASKNLKTTPLTTTDSILATQSEAEAGVENTAFMSALRTKQAIDSQVAWKDSNILKASSGNITYSVDVSYGQTGTPLFLSATGVWKLYGTYIGNGSQTQDEIFAKFYSADGANTTSPPNSLASSSSITVLSDSLEGEFTQRTNGAQNISTFTSPPVYIRTTFAVNVFYVPKLVANGAFASTNYKINIMAIKVSD